MSDSDFRELGERLATVEANVRNHADSDADFHSEMRESVVQLVDIANKGKGALWVVSLLLAALVALGVLPHLSVRLAPPAAAASHP